MQYTWQLALVLVPVYSIKHSVSCYIYYIHKYSLIEAGTVLYRDYAHVRNYAHPHF